MLPSALVMGTSSVFLLFCAMGVLVVVVALPSTFVFVLAAASCLSVMPCFSSSRRRWPLASTGEALATESQRVMGALGSAFMKVPVAVAIAAVGCEFLARCWIHSDVRLS